MKHLSAIAILEGKINSHQELIWDNNDMLDREWVMSRKLTLKERAKMKRQIKSSTKIIESLNETIKLLKESK